MAYNKTLPESELDIMLVIWRTPQPVSVPTIAAGLEKPLTASALHSYLKRLEEKGFLSCTKQGKRNLYTSLVNYRDYQRAAGVSMLDKLYHGSLTYFAAALYDGEKVDKAQLEELKELLDRLSGEEGK